jgi:hypothetical protein
VPDHDPAEQPPLTREQLAHEGRGLSMPHESVVRQEYWRAYDEGHIPYDSERVPPERSTQAACAGLEVSMEVPKAAASMRVTAQGSVKARHAEMSDAELLTTFELARIGCGMHEGHLPHVGTMLRLLRIWRELRRRRALNHSQTPVEQLSNRGR